MQPMALSSTLLIAVIATVIGAGQLFAQDIPSRPEPGVFPATAQDGDWTVVTMGPDGSWGVATSVAFGDALAEAIRQCKAVSSGQIGCGAQARATQGGWIVGLRCGDTNVIAAGKELAEAERVARRRATELGQLYQRDLVPCGRALIVGPQGAVYAKSWRQGGSTLTD